MKLPIKRLVQGLCLLHGLVAIQVLPVRAQDTKAPPTTPVARPIPRVSVRFVSRNADKPLTLHVAQTLKSNTSASAQSADVRQDKHYLKLCTADCVLEAPVGSHHFAVSEGQGHPIEVDTATTIHSPAILAAEYESDQDNRTSGWILLSTSLTVGLAAIILSIVAGANSDCGDTSCGPNGPLMAVGLLTSLFGGGISLPLIMDEDNVRLTQTVWRKP